MGDSATQPRRLAPAPTSTERATGHMDDARGTAPGRAVGSRTAGALARVGSLVRHRARLHEDTRRALGIWLISRAAYALASAIIAVVGVPSWVPVAAGTPRVIIGVATSAHDVLYRWWFWDAGFYMTIASRGYYAPAKTAWFPLYPLSVAALHHLWPVDDLVIGLLVSNVATLAAFIALAHLARRALGSRGVVPVLALLAAYPVAFFLAAAYTDGLALALTLWSLLWSVRGRWPLSLAAAFLAGLTRPTSVLLVLPLLAVYAHQEGWSAQLGLLWERVRDRLRRGGIVGLRSAVGVALSSSDSRPDELLRALGRPLAIVLVIPAAWSCYALYCALTFGQPFLFLTIQSSPDYGHGLVWPWQSLNIAAEQIGGAAPGSYLQLRLLIDFLPVLAVTACSALVLAQVIAPLVRRLVGRGGRMLAFTSPPLPWYWILWLFGVTLQVLCVGVTAPTAPDIYVSDCRYLLMAVPVPILMAGFLIRARPRAGRRPDAPTGRLALYGTLAALVALGVVIQAALLAFELNHGWLV